MILKAFGVVLLLVVTFSDVKAQTNVASVTFTFAPETKTSIETATIERVKQVGERRASERMVTRYEVRMEKVAGGYRRTTRPISFEFHRDGRKQENLLLATLARTPLTYLIDQRGQVTSISGYSDIADRLRAVLPAAQYNMVQSMANPTNLEQRDRAEWNGRIGDLVGLTCKIGESFSGESEMPLQEGPPLKFFTGWKCEKMVKCGGRWCVELRLIYTPDPDALKAFGDSMFGRIPSSPSATPVADASLSGEGTRVIDPKTLEAYSETVKRIIKFRVTNPAGTPTWMTLDEVRTLARER
jgi:hypothetical protein